MDFASFFRNQFDSRDISDDRINRYTVEHLQRLATVARFAPLFSATMTAHGAYFGAISDEATKAAIQKAFTRTMEQKLEEFKDLAARHEGAIRSKWGAESAEYLRFFPQGLTEYRTATLGNIDEKMTRLETAFTDLGAGLAAEVVAAFVAPGDVNNPAAPKGIIIRFRAARAAQLQAKGQTTGSKAASHGTRDALEVQLQKNLLTIALDGADKTTAVQAELLRLMPQSILGNATGSSGGTGTGNGGTPPPPPPPLLPPEVAVVTLTGSGATQTAHADAAGATMYRWHLRRTGEGEVTTVKEGPENFLDMTELAGTENFIQVIAINAAGQAPESAPLQFAGA